MANLSVLLLMALLTISGCKQDNSSEKNSKETKEITTSVEIKKENTDPISVTYETTPIDITATQLSQNYKGHDPEEFFRNASGINQQLQKGEFENTEQFKKRVKSLQQFPPFIKTLNNNAEFAFRVISYNPSYDADLQEFTFYFLVNSGIFDLRKYDSHKEPSYESAVVLELKTLDENKNSYEASNAFGATVQADMTSKTIIGIILGGALQHPKELKVSSYLTELKVNISSDKAKDVKENINILLIFKPKIPIIEHMTKARSATIDFPHAELTQLNLMVGDIIGVWLYNYKSGEIYKKYKLSK